MKLTTKARYGVRATFDVAYHGGRSPVQMGDITRRQSLPAHYMEQIFQKLRKAGILGSKRGPRGGYFLLKDPKDVTLYDIIAGTQGPIKLVYCVPEEGCVAGTEASPCEWAPRCPAHGMWKDMGEAIAEAFRKVTIEDMCVRAAAMGIEREG